jgi:hypothetical protein
MAMTLAVPNSMMPPSSANVPIPMPPIPSAPQAVDLAAQQAYANAIGGGSPSTPFASNPLAALAGALLSGIGAVAGALGNIANQLIFRGPSNLNWGRAGNAAINGAISNSFGGAFGYLIGGIGSSSAPGQKELFGGLGGTLGSIISPCPDSGIPSQDPNADKGGHCFGAAVGGQF